jgi:hypothetical protein
MDIEKRTLKKIIEERRRIELQTYLLPDDRAAVQEMHRRHVPICVYIFLHSSKVLRGPKPPQIGGFTITLRHTTFGKTPLDE